MYKFLRSILFLFPAEWAHYFSMNCLKALCSIGFLRRLIARLFSVPTIVNGHWSMNGLEFKNPIGLGAGFDKNAKYLRELQALGFGFVEIGTVTPLPQPGNPKPRLFRLPKNKALINRMGFNNDGVEVIVERLREWKSRETSNVKREIHASRLPTKDSRLIIGGNIGKNKSTPNEEAWKDYETCFKELHSFVDYFVVNVSSPNTPDLRELQEKESLRKILRHLQMINNGKARAKPIFLKIAPDLTKEQLDDVIDLVMEIQLDGIVATNTTVSREFLEGGSQESGVGSRESGSLPAGRQIRSREWEIGNRERGGLSGIPLRQKSTEIVRYIFEKTNGTVNIIASGGVFTFADAKEKMDAGAALVQVWTGFIYEGPGIVKKICKKLFSADLNTLINQ